MLRYFVMMIFFVLCSSELLKMFANVVLKSFDFHVFNMPSNHVLGLLTPSKYRLRLYDPDYAPVELVACVDHKYTQTVDGQYSCSICGAIGHMKLKRCIVVDDKIKDRFDNWYSKLASEFPKTPIYDRFMQIALVGESLENTEVQVLPIKTLVKYLLYVMYYEPKPKVSRQFMDFWDAVQLEIQKQEWKQSVKTT